MPEASEVFSDQILQRRVVENLLRQQLLQTPVLVLERPQALDGIVLYDFDQLQTMVAETYAIWAEVWTGRTEVIRRNGTSDGEGFGF